MIKRKLLLCTSIAALSLGTGAFAQAGTHDAKWGRPHCKRYGASLRRRGAGRTGPTERIGSRSRSGNA
jgi:hypothetical protein